MSMAHIAAMDAAMRLIPTQSIEDDLKNRCCELLSVVVAVEAITTRLLSSRDDDFPDTENGFMILPSKEALPLLSEVGLLLPVECLPTGSSFVANDEPPDVLWGGV